MSPLLVDFLDVGQGDGIFVRFPKGGTTMLVDLGSTKNKPIVTESLWAFFRKHTKFGTPKQRLDWLVLTHGDRDHYNLVLEFLDEFSVDVGNVFHGGLEADYGGLIATLKARENSNGTTPGIFTGPFVKSVTLAGDFGATVEVIAAGVDPGSARGVGYQKNTRSAVVRITCAGRKILLTGDATVNTEAAIMKKIPGLASDVLKVAHHGSHRTSNHARWLAAVNPTWAFISSDRSGSLDEDQKATGHRLPQALTLSLLAKYCPNLTTSANAHTVVASYQKTDYTSYNSAPDVKDETVGLPSGLPELWWWDPSVKWGVFTTLTKIGTQDNADADQGTQWEYVLADNGAQQVLSTD